MEGPLDSAGVVQPAFKVYFTYCLYKAALKLRYELDRALAPEGLFAPHMGIFRLLHGAAEPMSQVEIAAQLGVNRATMVKLLDHLEALKVIERRTHAADRRVNQIALTAKGKKMADKVAQLRQQVEDDFLSPLDAQERAVVKKAIPKLLR